MVQSQHSRVQPYFTHTQSTPPHVLPTPVPNSTVAAPTGSLSNSDTIFSSHNDSVNNIVSTGATPNLISLPLSNTVCDLGSLPNITPHASLSETDTTDYSLSPFSPNVHTSIQFEEQNGNISVNTQPGIGIEVILDRANKNVLSNSNLSESNILHPVDGLTNAIVNDHSMLTRGKRGIVQKKSFLSVLTEPSCDPTDFEPSHYKAALKIPAWKQAMQEEYDALMNQNTWTLVPLPPDKNLVPCKWIFKIKRNSDGSIARHKARLVARGFSQEYGVDFEETFSPVVRHTTVRLILGLAASSGWKLHQMDVKNAFLHGILNEEVYMTQPSGFENPSYPSFVCKLQKSLYGLKQAPRAWNERFTSFLPSIGFKFSYANPSLFVKVSGSSRVYLLLYVDDIIITGDSEDLISEVKAALQAEFDMKDLGDLHFFLGLEIKYIKDGIFLSQHKYTKDLIHKAGMDACHTHITPC
ncbi:putative RNA-directed DNA polymerase [Rosa chinensis]|uniref:Putative RNA-directed DNA polymerase n=1 Tax=Rosa chinensis TaxID=74649 RepID=A0A2P6PPR7_ROSCH|nr:putative RNA-directed DNA polymerase [Rosa chinensis]